MYIKSFQLTAGKEQVALFILNLKERSKITCLRNSESFSTQFSHYVCKKNRLAHFKTGCLPWPVSNEPNKNLFTNWTTGFKMGLLVLKWAKSQIGP